MRCGGSGDGAEPSLSLGRRTQECAAARGGLREEVGMGTPEGEVPEGLGEGPRLGTRRSLPLSGLSNSSSRKSREGQVGPPCEHTQYRAHPGIIIIN